MNWADVWRIIISAIASVGGISVIIIAVTKSLSEFIAESLLKKYQSELDKEIETYKRDLEIEIEKVRSQNEHVKYVSQRQFDAEFSAYEKIFECMFEFSVYTRQLYPAFEWLITDKDKRKEVYTHRSEDFRNAFNMFSETVEKKAPFMSKELYDVFVEMRELAYKIAKNYDKIRIEDDELDKDYYREEMYNKYPEEEQLESLVQQSKDNVREYLGMLRVYT